MKSWLSTLAFCALVSAARSADPLPIPQQALALTKAHGCSPISDYFDTRTTIGEDPPYALVAGGTRQLQVAVWCTADLSKAEGQRSYMLLLRIDDASSPLAKCPAAIRGSTNIGGLRFVDISEDLKYYYYVDTRKRVASVGELHTKGVESTYDGVGKRYVCINGKWAFNAFD
jgi:hypothetical protein